MSLIINTNINNDSVSVKANLANAVIEASKSINTLLSAGNLALVYSVSELTDIEYNPNNGLIRPASTIKSK